MEMRRLTEIIINYENNNFTLYVDEADFASYLPLVGVIQEW